MLLLPNNSLQIVKSNIVQCLRTMRSQGSQTHLVVIAEWWGFRSCWFIRLYWFVASYAQDITIFWMLWVALACGSKRNTVAVILVCDCIGVRIMRRPMRFELILFVMLFILSKQTFSYIKWALHRKWVYQHNGLPRFSLRWDPLTPSLIPSISWGKHSQYVRIFLV